MSPLSDNYTVLKEHRTEFDPKQFNEKIVQVLLKYDFLVGDIADERLRLKGFYHNKRRNVDSDKRASTIEKYIKESCNYMCSYYVLEKTHDNARRKKTIGKHHNNKKRTKGKPTQTEDVTQ